MWQNIRAAIKGKESAEYFPETQKSQANPESHVSLYKRKEKKNKEDLYIHGRLDPVNKENQEGIYSVK